MDALELLVAEHASILRRFDELTTLLARDRRPRLDELIRVLDAHLTIDEQLTFPETCAHGHFAVLAKIAARDVEAALHDLFTLDASRGDFVHRLLEIRAAVEGAIAIEEQMLYPDLAEAVPCERLIALGHKIQVWLKLLTADAAAA
jgi:hypothetical protein